MKYVCRDCASEDLLFDSISRFNQRTLMFDLVEVLDGVYCNSCEEYVTAEEDYTDE